MLKVRCGAGMNIVCLQFDLAWADKPANFARVRQLLAAQPLPRGALVILPEMFGTGFCLEPERTAEGDNGETAQFLASLAREFDVRVLGGLVRRDPAGVVRNELIGFEPTGAEFVRYAKRHPFTRGGEAKVHQPGDRIVTFAHDGWVVAPFICYDLRFPEDFRQAVRRGAEVLVVIANWPELRIDHWLLLLRARAIENQAFVVGVNRVGSDPSAPYPGRSLVVGPRGDVLLDAGGDSGAFPTTLDQSVLRQWRADFPALADMRPE